MHTTNYFDTVILPPADTRATAAIAPPTGKRTVAELQFERLFGHDYEWTSDDLIFDVHCERKGIAAADRADARATFFAKGQPCLRTSPLAKTYGWALHFDRDGHIALLPMGTEQLERMTSEDAITVRNAMRASR